MPSRFPSPEHIAFDKKQLLIRWDDGEICAFELLALRRFCPCAHCKGGHAPDAPRKTGHIHEIQLLHFEYVGHYALRLHWSDGHHTGIYTFDFLRDATTRAKAAASSSSAPLLS